jgi:nicotinamide-nucleotide amidase
VTLRVTARAADVTAARAVLDPVEREIRGRVGEACFGADEESLASVVLRELAERHQTLAVAESCTGGGLGAALAAVPGASHCWLGGVMAYANHAKRELLGVPGELVERWGAVSDPVALAMAEGVRQRLGSDWAVAITGIAGPGGASAEKPVGLVHLAVVGPEPVAPWSEGVRFGASRGRQAIQALSVGEALNRLRLCLLHNHP